MDYFYLAQQLIREVYRSHTTTHHSGYDSSGRVISPTQRQHTTSTRDGHHASDGIRTHNLSRRAVEDLRLRPRGH